MLLEPPQPQRAVCFLESGLTGLLSKDDYSDDRRDNDLTERLNEGDILTCKIKSIVKNERIKVFLSCRESDLRSDLSKEYKKIPYYHEDLDSIETVKEKARKAKELAKKHFKSRMIVHPRFQNITADEAMEVRVWIISFILYLHKNGVFAYISFRKCIIAYISKACIKTIVLCA